MAVTPSGAYTTWKDWLIAALFAAMIAVCGYAFNSIDARMNVNETRIKDIELALPTRAERIRALEIKSDNTAQTLQEINSKIDRLLMMHVK